MPVLPPAFLRSLPASGSVQAHTLIYSQTRALRKSPDVANGHLALLAQGTAHIMNDRIGSQASQRMSKKVGGHALQHLQQPCGIKAAVAVSWTLGMKTPDLLQQACSALQQDTEGVQASALLRLLADSRGERTQTLRDRGGCTPSGAKYTRPSSPYWPSRCRSFCGFCVYGDTVTRSSRCAASATSTHRRKAGDSQTQGPGVRPGGTMCGGILLMYKMPAAGHTQAQSTALGIPGMLPSGLTRAGG